MTIIETFDTMMNKGLFDIGCALYKLFPFDLGISSYIRKNELHVLDLCNYDKSLIPIIGKQSCHSMQLDIIQIVVTNYDYIPPRGRLNEIVWTMCWRRRFDLIKLFIDRDLISIRCSCLDEIFKLVVEMPHWDLFDLLIEKKLYKQKHLDDCVDRVYNDDELEHILKAGANPNVECREHIDRANRTDRISTYEILLKYGFNINSWNGSAIRSAVSYGHPGVIKFLIDNGADVNIRKGQPIINAIWYVHNNKMEILNLLADNGADIEVIVNRYRYIRRKCYFYKVDLMNIYNTLKERITNVV